LRRAGRGSEAGYSMVALLAAAAVMLVLMTAAMPSWRYVMKDDAEQELLFRGGEIADAIARYQKKNGNALPPSLEVLVKGKFLRHAYKDPMAKGGRWRFIRPGETVGPVPGAPGSAMATTTTTTTTTTRPSAFAQPGAVFGAIQGVASTSTEKSIRIFNGRTRYNEWVFLPGQPRVIGRAPTGGSGGAGGALVSRPSGTGTALPGVAAPGVFPGVAPP